MPRPKGTDYLPAGTIKTSRPSFLAKLGRAVRWVFSSPRRFLTILLVLGALTAAGYFYFLYTDAQRLLADPQEAAQEAVDETVSQVSRLMELPADETPTLATVTDAEKLKSQTFFAKAQNGDKVLLYPNNRLAILYRPSENKIIAVGTINVQTSGNQ